MADVALSLSGGGFRAAMFHLGTLHYLYNLKYKDGHSFLEDVHTISTISGGTLTGLWYMMCYCEDCDVNEAIEELYLKMVMTSLPNEVIPNLLKDPKSHTSLICEMVAAYDKYFFKGKRFDIILDKIDQGPIHHFCAGGTDFGNGLPFRFQATRKIINVAQSIKERGIIGNFRHQVDERVGREIKLSEIMAVSSCFPGAFEPMRFPEDFDFYTKEENKNVVDSFSRFAKMDGGIVDNQGVEPLKLANTHLTYDEPAANAGGKTDTEYMCLDLSIISDVANPSVPQDEDWIMKKCQRWSLLGVSSVLLLLLLLCVLAIIVGVVYSWASLMIIGIILTALVEPLFFLVVLLEILLLIGIKLSPFKMSWIKILKINFSKWGTLLSSRVRSLKSLVMNVFMKHIRKMQYSTVYGDKKWQDRLIANNLSELSTKGSWIWKKNYPEYLKPSEVMKANTDVVADMSSTLWFTSKHLRDGYPQSLFTAGQYTICMNLLEYVEKIKAVDASQLTAFQQQMLTLEDKLKADWNEFKKNPQWMMIEIPE